MTGSGDNDIPGASTPAAKVLGRSEKRPLPKKFYKQARSEASGAGFRIMLDGRPVKTPGKLVLSVPTAALAEAIASEWQAQGKTIDPATMPLTRLTNTALDAVSGREAEVAADIVKYAGSDLLCYRAESPEGLVRKQSEAWDGVLAWAKSELRADFVLGNGIIHVAQSPAALDRIAAAIAGYDALHLTALHVMTTLMGSTLLALAVARGRLTVEAAWAAAHIDEDWQISQWGEDAEAAARRAHRWSEMQAAAKLVA